MRDGNNKNICRVIALFVLCISMILVISNKQNIHVDEFMSYGLSNAKMEEGIDITYQDGVKYFPAVDLYLEHMTVNESGRFDFRNVWINQGRDVHPPLYYVLFHLISSVFIGSTSYWIPGSINILFICLTFLVSYKIVYLISRDKTIANMFCGFFAVSVGILNVASWMRMYAVAMFWCTLVTWILLCFLNKENIGIVDCVKLVGAVVGGALTHYYCIIWAVLGVAVYVVICIIKKQIKTVAYLLGSMLISGGGALVFFPAMWQHVFHGYRGEQAFDNLFNLGDLLARFTDFYKIISRELFGGFLSILLCGIVVLIIWKKEISREIFWKEREKWSLLIIPSICFFALVSKIAVWATDRYLFPAYGVFLIVVFTGGFLLIKSIYKSKFVLICVFLLVLITMGGNYNAKWEYLYLDAEQYLQECENYSDVDCLFIHDGCQWKAGPAYKEISNFKSVTFVSEMEEIQHDDFADNDSLIVMMVEEDEKFIREIVNRYPQLNSYRYVGAFGYTRTYLFETQKN